MVPNGLACDEFARLSSGGCPKAGQVLFLGAGREDLDRDKGLEDLLAVLPELWREHAQSLWVLAGLANPESTYEGLKRTGVDPEGSGPRVRSSSRPALPSRQRPAP